MWRNSTLVRFGRFSTNRLSRTLLFFSRPLWKKVRVWSMHWGSKIFTSHRNSTTYKSNTDTFVINHRPWKSRFQRLLFFYTEIEPFLGLRHQGQKRIYEIENARLWWKSWFGRARPVDRDSSVSILCKVFMLTCPCLKPQLLHSFVLQALPSVQPLVDVVMIVANSIN